MMTYLQVRDILNLIRSYHLRLQRALEEVADTSGVELTEGLANQLQVHEQHWQVALKEYGEEGEEAVLNSYIQYLPDNGVQEVLNDIRITPKMSMDDVRQLVVRFHAALIDFYGSLKEEVTAPQVKEFFRRLHDLEQTLTAEQAWSGRTV